MFSSTEDWLISGSGTSSHWSGGTISGKSKTEITGCQSVLKSFMEDQAFWLSYDLVPSLPPPKVYRQQEGEKAWSSISHSILSDC